MKKLKNFVGVAICAILCICSMIVFTGCKDNKKNTRLFVFATVGGCVQVNDSTDCVEFGDEGEIFKFKQKSKVSLKAIPDAGYDFVKWEYADDLDKRQEDFSTQQEISLVMDKDEIVIRAVFATNGSISYDVNYTNDYTKYVIVPETGYTDTVLLGGEFKFKIYITAEYQQQYNVVIKSNNRILTSDVNNIYTISNVNSDINITVEFTPISEETQKFEVSLPISPYYTICKTDGSAFGTNSVEVEEGEQFKFKINVTSAYQQYNMVVKSNNTVLTPNASKIYTISNISRDINIVVEFTEIEDETQIFDIILTTSPYYTICKDDGSAFESNTVEVEEGVVFRFKVSSSYMVIVKANGRVLIPTNNIYTTSVNEDITIFVDVYFEVTVPQSTKYEIVDVDGNSYESKEVVLLNNWFEFKLNLANSVESATVKINNQVVTPVNNVYKVSATGNLVITVNVVDKVEKVTYSFALSFDDTIEGLIGSDVYNFPQSMSFEININAEKLEEYIASEFMVKTSFGQNSISVRDLFADMNTELLNLGLGFTGIKCLAVDGIEFMSVDINDIMHINWSLINSFSVNNVTIVVE